MAIKISRLLGTPFWRPGTPRGIPGTPFVPPRVPTPAPRGMPGLNGGLGPGGPSGLIGDVVRVAGRQRGFLILDRGGSKFTFIKTARRQRFRRTEGRGKGTFDKALQIALIKAMLK